MALTPPQIRWLGALLLAAQLPQAPFTCRSGSPRSARCWSRCACCCCGAIASAPNAKPARIPSWALAFFALAAGIAIRQSFGYFLGRDPCVAFLFVLVGIKFLEARTARDGTLLVCLASFLIVTPFFYSQSLLAALRGAARAAADRRHARGAGAAGAARLRRSSVARADPAHAA